MANVEKVKYYTAYNDEAYFYKLNGEFLKDEDGYLIGHNADETKRQIKVKNLSYPFMDEERYKLKQTRNYIPHQEYEVEVIQFTDDTDLEEIEKFIVDNTGFTNIEFVEVVDKHDEVFGYLLKLEMGGKQEVRAFNKNDFLLIDYFRDVQVIGWEHFSSNYIKKDGVNFWKLKYAKLAGENSNGK